jgi:hypothetical protein
MAKDKPKIKTGIKSGSSGILRKQSEDSFDIGKYDTLIYVGIIILAVLIFFKDGVFGGKVFATSDNIAFDSFRTFLDDAKKNGVFPLWTPYIFMGMPNFPIIGFNPRVYDFFYYIWDSVFGVITNSSTNTVLPIVMYYVIFGIGFYFYANNRFKNKLIALYCALAATFATDFIQRIVVGHNTKVLSLAFFPFILLIIDRLIYSFTHKDKGIFTASNLLNLFFLALMLHIQLNSNHIQMIFYAYLMIGIYLLYLIIYSFVKKENFSGMIKAGVFFIVAALIAVAMNADVLMTMKEYNKYSIRGEAGIEAKLDPKVTNDTPLDYQYATNWSFSPGEVITFLLPYYYGFGDVQVQGQKANLYWGQMPFTTNPMYFGVIVLVLSVIGIWYNFRRNPVVQAFTVIAFLFLFMSFGRNFSVIYDLFFNFFPYFSSFRAPVMIHHFMNISIVVLSGYGLKSIVDAASVAGSTDRFKKMSYAFFGVAGLMILISIVGFQDSYASSIASSPLADKLKQQGANAQQISQYIKQISTIAYENIISDLRLHGFFIAILTALAYFYVTGKVKGKMFLGGVILLTLFDLWNVNFKTLHWDDAGDQQNAFAEKDYISWLNKNEPDPYAYRVAELRGGNLVTDNSLAYFRIHAFNGYQGAKIRIYQDAIDVAGGENPLLLTLGGVKYVISETPMQDTNFVLAFKGTGGNVYKNKAFNSKSYFVDEYKVEKDINILNNIRDMNFDPEKIAFLEKDPGVKIDRPDSTAAVKLIKSDIHNLEYEVNASGNNLLVFSEIYLPFGWKAFVDGKEADIHKTNYILRSLVIPAGKHKIEFRYVPDTYFTGKSISIGANVFLALILIAGVIGYAGSRKRDTEGTQNIANEDQKEN